MQVIIVIIYIQELNYDILNPLFVGDSTEKLLFPIIYFFYSFCFAF